MLKEKEKEQQEKLKALRREIEEKLEEQLPPEMARASSARALFRAGLMKNQPEMLDEKTRVEVQRIDENQVLPDDRVKQIIEALLFASSKPVMIPEIRKIMKFLTPKQIEAFIVQLREDYAQNNRSFEILEVAGGYEVATKKEFAPWIFKIELQKKAKQVTQSALETLSILAYKQPITRAEIEELRGVDAGGVLNTLMERSLIKIVGKKEVPGRPFLYGTTEKFLEHFGLKSLQDLPNIDEIKNLVEKSVKKEELLGRPQIIDVSQEVPVPEVPGSNEEETEPGTSGTGTQEPEEEQPAKDPL